MSSTIQRTDRETKSEGGETSRSRRSQGMGGGENIKQEKNIESSKVFSPMEEVYSKI